MQKNNILVTNNKQYNYMQIIHKSENKQIFVVQKLKLQQPLSG